MKKFLFVAALTASLSGCSTFAGQTPSQIVSSVVAEVQSATQALCKFAPIASSVAAIVAAAPASAAVATIASAICGAVANAPASAHLHAAAPQAVATVYGQPVVGNFVR
jgi:hypothetical protein